MANDARLKIIIDALNLASDELERVEGDLQGVTGASKKSASSWTELNSAIGVGKQALETVSQAYDAVIGTTIRWGDEIDELSRITGTSTAESSRLAIVLGDLGVDMGKLKGAANALKEQGLTPSLDTIKKLAVEYQSIDGAAARTEWGTKTLGKAYFELSEILDQPIDKINKLADAADHSGKVMSETSVAALEAYQIQINQAKDTWEGFTTAVGMRAVTFASATKAVIDGSISLKEYDQIVRDMRYSLKSSDEILLELTDAQRKNTDVVVAAEDEQAKLEYQTSRTNAAAIAAVNAWGAAQMEMGDAAAAARDITDAQEKLHLAQLALAAGLSGSVTSAIESETDVRADNRDEIAKLQGELAKLEKQQGKVVTVTTEATASEAEHQLALIDLQKAQEKLAQTNSGSTEEWLKAQVAVEGAQEKVEKLGLALGSSSTYAIDNSTKIAEVKGKLDELTTAEERAEEATRKAAGQMLYQQGVAAGLKEPALTELARSLGLVSQTDYDAALAMQALTAEYQKTGDLETYTTKSRDLETALGLIAKYNGMTIDIALRATAVGNAAGLFTDVNAVGDLGAYGGPVPGAKTPTPPSKPGKPGAPPPPKIGGANGLDFVVPPGYPNDSYTVGVQSGERVTVTPPGQVSGQTNVFNISNPDPRAVAREVSQILAAQARAMTLAGARYVGS